MSLNNCRVLLFSWCALVKLRNLQQFVKVKKKSGKMMSKIFPSLLVVLVGIRDSASRLTILVN